MRTLAICDVESKQKNIDELIYRLLFDTLYNEYYINFDNYCYYYDRLVFKEKIKEVLKRGDIEIVDDSIIHTEEEILWYICIKRL